MIKKMAKINPGWGVMVIIIATVMIATAAFGQETQIDISLGQGKQLGFVETLTATAQGFVFKQIAYLVAAIAFIMGIITGLKRHIGWAIGCCVLGGLAICSKSILEAIAQMVQ